MNWYYAENGQERGPVSEVELMTLVQSGKINDTTLVWKEDMTQWRPYGEVKPSMGAPPPGAAIRVAVTPGADVVCAECGRSFPKDQTVVFGTVSVCAQCKPLFVQRLREGVAPTGRRGRRPLPVNPDQLLQEVLSRDIKVDIGPCITRAWEAVKANFWLAVGTSFLILLCMGASGMIPLIGTCLGLIFSGPLMGGLYLFLLKLVRGEPAAVGDGFAGFSKLFVPFMAVYLLMCLCVYAPFIPCAAYYFIALRHAGSPPFDAIFAVLAFAGVVAAGFLGVAFSMALPLAGDLELGPMDALRVSWRVVTRKWFSFFGLALACGLVALVGFLALCVGLLVAAPVVYAAWIWAYEDIFGADPGGSLG